MIKGYRSFRAGVSGCFTRWPVAPSWQPQQRWERRRREKPHRPPGFDAWAGSAARCDGGMRRTAGPGRSMAEATGPCVLLDHLVCGGQQRFRDGEAERLGGLEVDDEFVFGRKLNGKVGQLRPA